MEMSAEHTATNEKQPFPRQRMIPTIPSGFKSSIVGVIPNDWGIVPLSTLVISGPRNGYSGRSGKEARGTPTLSLGATTSGFMMLNEETVKRLDETIDANSDLFLRPGDVLVQRSNTADLVGTTAVFDGPADVYVYPDLMMRMRFRDHETAQWFWRFANSSRGRQFYLSIAAGSSGSMPKISGAKLRSMWIPLPPRGEQLAIAAAFGEVDRLLAALEALIVKKRAIKKATMQQLLTGKIRLPGFSREWKPKLLGEFVTIRNQKVLPSQVDSETPCVELEHLSQGAGLLLSFSTAQGSTSSKYRFLSGDVLFGRLRPYLRKFWHADFAGICTTEIWPLAVNANQASSGFLRALVETDRFIGMASISYGTHMPRADWGVMRKLEIQLPSLEEQNAIAAVFSDMDAVIAALEERRDKTIAIKQGMMQQLLTGRIRLIKPEQAEVTA